jgi:hypothetical protein
MLPVCAPCSALAGRVCSTARAPPRGRWCGGGRRGSGWSCCSRTRESGCVFWREVAARASVHCWARCKRGKGRLPGLSMDAGGSQPRARRPARPRPSAGAAPGRRSLLEQLHSGGAVVQRQQLRQLRLVVGQRELGWGWEWVCGGLGRAGERGFVLWRGLPSCCGVSVQRLGPFTHCQIGRALPSGLRFQVGAAELCRWPAPVTRAARLRPNGRLPRRRPSPPPSPRWWPRPACGRLWRLGRTPWGVWGQMETAAAATRVGTRPPSRSVCARAAHH